MAQQLSAKQYIQTRARNLPVYKCFVNKDWETARMAQVIVMRRHVNGNLTTGVFLVDLLCLGVKDTTYFFNEPEEDLNERLGDEFTKVFEEADYALAHNIVYAGHDFALEYDIKPHEDFAITRFMLQEDTDDVELIDIEVGTEGKPHLFVQQPGQYSGALAKLKKNAGEGNYFYSIAGDEEDAAEGVEDFEEGYPGDDENVEEGNTAAEWAEEENNDEEDEETPRTLEEIEIGELTVLGARFIDDEDIFNEHEVSERDEEEKLTINVEAGIRALHISRAEFFENYEEDEITPTFLVNEHLASGVSSEEETSFIEARTDLISYYEGLSEEGLALAGNEKTMLFNMLQKHSTNPLVVSMIFENSLFDADDTLCMRAKDNLLALANYSVPAALSLALAALIKREAADDIYNFIYESNNIAEAFTETTDFGSNDVNKYCLIKALKGIRDNNLALAVYYYYLASETEEYTSLLISIQADLLVAIGQELGFDKGEDDIKPVLRIV